MALETLDPRRLGKQGIRIRHWRLEFGACSLSLLLACSSTEVIGRGEAVVAGRVTDASGQQVSGAVLRIQGFRMGTTEDLFLSLDTTDAAGEYARLVFNDALDIDTRVVIELTPPPGRALGTVVKEVDSLRLRSGVAFPPETTRVDFTLPPTSADVAGTYEAISFTTQPTGSASTSDLLTQGASLKLVLDTGSTVTGRLFVPHGNEDGGDLDADLAGTWSLNGNTVAFQQAADTFVRDMPFAFANGRLTGEREFSGTILRVVLDKR